jgi:hypothetical protein
MNTERFVRILGGGSVLISLGLGLPASPAFVSQRFLWIAAFVGFSLFQSGFTGFCPTEIVLRALGVKTPAEAD